MFETHSSTWRKTDESVCADPRKQAFIPAILHKHMTEEWVSVPPRRTFTQMLATSRNAAKYANLTSQQIKTNVHSEHDTIHQWCILKCYQEAKWTRTYCSVASSFEKRESRVWVRRQATESSLKWRKYTRPPINWLLVSVLTSKTLPGLPSVKSGVILQTSHPGICQTLLGTDSTSFFHSLPITKSKTYAEKNVVAGKYYHW